MEGFDWAGLANSAMQTYSGGNGQTAQPTGGGGMYSAESSINVSTGGIDLSGGSLPDGALPLLLAGFAGLVIGFLLVKM